MTHNRPTTRAARLPRRYPWAGLVHVITFVTLAVACLSMAVTLRTSEQERARLVSQLNDARTEQAEVETRLELVRANWLEDRVKLRELAARLNLSDHY